MAKKSTSNVREKVVKAALKLAKTKGWEQTSMADIAKQSKLSIKDLHEHFIDRSDILCAYGRMIDKRVIEAIGDPDESLSAKDRLFDALMERFDVINEDREAVCSILESLCHDPKQALISMPHLGHSMSWMLEISGIETSGYKGALKILALTGIYLKALKSWKADDTEDMAKTMATLDNALSRAERLAETIGLKN